MVFSPNKECVRLQSVGVLRFTDKSACHLSKKHPEENENTHLILIKVFHLCFITIACIYCCCIVMDLVTWTSIYIIFWHEERGQVNQPNKADPRHDLPFEGLVPFSFWHNG